MAATVTVRLRPRTTWGPATAARPWPLRGMGLSLAGHALVVAGIAVAAVLWGPSPTRTYVVNLVPSIPAVGAPAGQPSPPRAEQRPTPPARPPEPPPRPVRAAPEVTREPKAARPAPEVTREAKAARPAPEPVREPSSSRPAPELPAPAREAPALPERAAPPREAALPRPGPRELPVREAPPPRASSKELPAIASAAPPRAVTPPSPPPPAPPSAPVRELPAPAPPLGRPGGVAQGVGAMAAMSGDFPFAYYLRSIERKVYEKWTRPLTSAEGQHVVVVFEIARNGQVSGERVEKSSGDAAYDLAAVRAVSEAKPMPPLPDGFKGSVLRVHFGFTYSGQQG